MSTPSSLMWSFLLGTWVGTGSLRDGDLDSRTEVTGLLGPNLRSDLVCWSGGREVHREQTIWFVHPDSGPSALSLDGHGRATHWRVREAAAGHLELTPADCEPPTRRSLRWSLVLRPDGTLEETYREDADAAPLVRLEHARERTP